MSPDNPALGYFTAFSNTEHTGACDKHDECYQTCWAGDASAREAARLACDQKLRDIARLKCLDELIVSPANTAACLAYAEVYYQFLKDLFGKSAFEKRQKQVCNCCK